MPSRKPAPFLMVAWLLLPSFSAAFTLPASRGAVLGQPRAAASSSDDAGMRDKYLSRLGVDAAIVEREPNAEDLQDLLTVHLSSIPFENLGQHEHPSACLPSRSRYYQRSTSTSA